MAKQIKELSALAVSKFKAEGTYAVGGVTGLNLRVDGNSRRWILRISVSGTRRNMGLGSYPDISLAQARELAKEAHTLISRGLDPIDERQKVQRELELERSKRVTFEEAAIRFIRSKEAEWTYKHARQWQATLETYTFPIMGKLSVADIDKTHLIAVLDPIWRDKTETAKRVRGRIEQVIDWSIFCGYRTAENPARWRGYLDRVLPKPSKIMQVRHMPALPFEEVAVAVHEINQRKGMGAKALIFQILTAARSGEVRGAVWEEIDLKSHEWTIPAKRMKAGREHRVPLAAQAVQLLSELDRFKACPYLFPSISFKPLSDMTMTNLLRDMQLKSRLGDTVVPHGFRSTFRDWVAECTNYSNEVAEMAVAHAISNKAEAAYRRGDLFMKRQQMMQEWADYCYNYSA